MCLYFSDPKDAFKITDETGSLGLVECRGMTRVLVHPLRGSNTKCIHSARNILNPAHFRYDSYLILPLLSFICLL